MSKSIYELKLNEFEVIKEVNLAGTIINTVVIRVPGGWIYKSEKQINVGDHSAITSSSVFVPYSNEFKEKTTPSLSEPLVG